MTRTSLVLGFAAALVVPAGGGFALGDDVLGRVKNLTDEVAPKVVEWRRDLHAHPELSNREERTADGLGCTAEIEMDDYGPVVWNDPELGELTLPSLERAAGEDNVVEASPVMVGEDFAHYAKKVPGFFIFLGVRNESIGAVHALHTPNMVIDEAALPLGVRAHCLMALDYLRRQSRAAGDDPS
jgi:metal-dependent amidase/aminoacylase/carboxypeptidase family protein